MDGKCHKCGSTRLESGQIEGAAIRLDRSSTMKKVFSVGSAILCDVCIDCGAIGNLRGDPQKLAEMVD